MIKLSELFDIKYGNNLALIDMVVAKSNDDYVNFISRTSQNNGVIEKVRRISSIMPFKKGLLTVAVSGSVLESFVQDRDFYTAYHVMVLEPKIQMSFFEKQFYAMCIRKNKFRYNYGRQANRTLKDLEVPRKVPDWVHNFELPEFTMRGTNNILFLDPNVINNSSIAVEKALLETCFWKEYKIEDLFRLENCKCKKAEDLKDGNEIYYIGAKKSDNGVMRKVKIEDDLVTKGNAIVFIGDGQGSVGYSLYMDRDFIGSTTLTAGYNKFLNKYNGLFLVTVLDLERKKYSYGRKYKSNIKNTIIKLPADNMGHPDWQYMENYIKSLPYSKYI